jgi:hypothetical protein
VRRDGRGGLPRRYERCNRFIPLRHALAGAAQARQQPLHDAAVDGLVIRDQQVQAEAGRRGRHKGAWGGGTGTQWAGQTRAGQTSSGARLPRPRQRRCLLRPLLLLKLKLCHAQQGQLRGRQSLVHAALTQGRLLRLRRRQLRELQLLLLLLL